MKNASILILFFLILFISCSKNSSVNINNDEITNKTAMSAGPPWRWEWDEWGRKKKLCEGNGLCNFRRKQSFIPAEKSSLIYENTDGTKYVIVLVDSDLVYEDGTLNLHIDEDMVHIAEEDGSICRVNAGVYEIDSSLGTMGGYVIPIYIY